VTLAAVSYDAGYYAGNDQDGDRPALRFYARVAARLAPPGARVLDFGCGTGHFARHLARRFQTTAFDPSQYAREATARRSPPTQVIDDLDALPAGGLALVCALHVLEHIPDPAPTLRRLHDLLAPGGRVLYVVPDPDGAGHRIKIQDWFAYRDPTHCTLLESAAWLAQTRASGLEIERVATDGLWDPPYVRRLPRALQLPLFGAPAAVQVALGRLVLPAGWGECLIIVARRGPAR
jgi:SAM-dependent methyltransferase